MVVPGLPYFYRKDIDFCACVCVGRGMIFVFDWLTSSCLLGRHCLVYGEYVDQ